MLFIKIYQGAVLAETKGEASHPIVFDSQLENPRLLDTGENVGLEMFFGVPFWNFRGVSVSSFIISIRGEANSGSSLNFLCFGFSWYR